ncbi:MAG: hypothetical protein JWN48_4352 [Myxococcaceae bacterium]|nr:hypothetical protein [Myxococcaceae bacterium]
MTASSRQARGADLTGAVVVASLRVEAMATTRKKPWTALATQLAEDPEQLTSAQGAALLRELLAHADGPAIALAARLIEQHALPGYEEALAATYRSLCDERLHVDADCQAKEAIVGALDALHYLSADFFAAAARYVQRAKSKGLARDTAARVRSRGVLGVARLGHVDAFPLFGAALTDPDPTVRLSAARAVAHRGARDGAGLLLLRLGVGDGEPEVVVECLRGLLSLAPDLAVPVAHALLGAGPLAREQALSALGTAPCDEAVELLERAMRECTLAADRAQVIEALGLSLRPRARTFLLSLLESEHSADAQSALRVLAIHRYDGRLAEQVRKASAHSRELARSAAELFG